MITALLVAVAIVAGIDLRRVALLAAAVHLPLILGTLIALVTWRARPHDDARPALFCEVVASELRAGATLRHAVVAAARSVGLPGVEADVPLFLLADQLALGLPEIGPELRLTVVSAGRSGADAAVLFDEIGSLALAQVETRNEVRVATAPGRATALVLVVAPLLYLLTRLGRGGLGDLLLAPGQRLVAVAGLGLFLFGLSVALTILWRAGR